MNKIILFLLIILLSSKTHAQDKPWASLVSKDYKIKVDFKNQNISSIAKWYSNKSGVVIIADKGLKGNFNISSVGQINVSEAFDFLEAFLNLQEF